MNDNLYNKLKTEAIDQFEECIPILNAENNAKDSFCYFLFNDLINIGSLNNIDIDDIISNSKSILYDNLNNIYNDISNANQELLIEFQNKLIKQQSIAINKVKECNDHLKLLKNIYINEFIGSYITINKNSINFNIENKKVLVIDNIKNQLILGEFFSRFLFNLIISDVTGISIIRLSTIFYDPTIINDYIDTTNFKINNFNDISINFKYWFILIFLIGHIFSKNSPFDTIFNGKQLDKLINDILTEDKKKEKKKDEKKKRTTTITRGGSRNNIIHRQITEKKKNNSNNITNYKSKYNTFLKDITTTYNNESLDRIYKIPFHRNMKDIFTQQLLSIRINLNMKFKNPFNNNDIPLKDLLPNFKNSPPAQAITSTNILPKMDNIKFDIYESLNLLKNINNKNEINDFLNKLKKKLILLLFFLYDIKKNIYEEYNESITEIFNLNIPSTNNKTDIKTNEKKDNSKTDNSKNIDKKSNSKSDNSKTNDKKSNSKLDNRKSVIEINNGLSNSQKEIKILKDKLKKLKNKSNIDSDIEILAIEKEIKHRLVDEYNKSRYI